MCDKVWRWCFQVFQVCSSLYMIVCGKDINLRYE